MKVAIYARYSSDNQRDASIADQLRVCREFAARQAWTVVQEFTDHAISGASLLRSGFQALMRDALNARFDIVLAEALDRFSRDQEDTAGLFKRLTFAGVCFGARSRGTCTNRLTISRQEVEERVLVALRDKLMRRDLFEDFCREYVRELNRLRMEHRAGLSCARTELATIEREIRKLVQAIKDGVPALSIKDELLSLEARKAEMQSRLNAPEMPELLHPRMADVYREKVGSLCSALESEESRTGAVEAIRALIETIPARTRWGPAEDHAEGRPGGNAECGQRQQEVARYRRPHGPNKAGCGGGI